MIHEVQEGYVKTETKAGITSIEFFHPKANSLPRTLLTELAQEIHSAGMDPDTRVIILRSGGDGAFCSGASFKELTALQTAEEGRIFFSGFADVINAIRRCPQFVIARVHGKLVGGGVGIAAAADYAIATEAAEVKLSELAIGFGPFVVGPAIERKIGTTAFGQIAIDSAMWRPADWARRKGLFAELHPNTENMDESVARLANELAHSNPEAMSELKKILWKGTEHWDTLLPERAETSGRLAVSVFSRAAIAKLQGKP